MMLLALEHMWVGGRVCIHMQYFILKSSGFWNYPSEGRKTSQEVWSLVAQPIGLQSQTQNAACKPWIFKAAAWMNNFPVNALYEACPCSSGILDNLLPVVKVSPLNNKCPRLALIAATQLLIVTWEFSPVQNSLKEKGLFVPMTRVSCEVSDWEHPV